MNTYRHHIITQTLALLPSKRLICLAAYAAHRQQGPCPPVWRPFKFYQYRRRQQALKWLLDAVARSLRGHYTVGFYLGALLPDMSAADYHATLLHAPPICKTCSTTPQRTTRHLLSWTTCPTNPAKP